MYILFCSTKQKELSEMGVKSRNSRCSEWEACDDWRVMKKPDLRRTIWQCDIHVRIKHMTAESMNEVTSYIGLRYPASWRCNCQRVLLSEYANSFSYCSCIDKRLRLRLSGSKEA